jgi:hypothetical protein
MTRSQAESRLRELMSIAAATPPAPEPGVTITLGRSAFVEQLEARGRSKSHIETVESHVRVHLVPFFKAQAARPDHRDRRHPSPDPSAPRWSKAEDRPQRVLDSAFDLRAGGAPRLG